MSNDGGPFVIDASAVLALLFAEPGAEVVNKCLAAGTISVVNLAETLAKLVDRGVPVSEAARAVALLALKVAPMTETQAETSAAMRPISRLADLAPRRPIARRSRMSRAGHGLGSPRPDRRPKLGNNRGSPGCPYHTDSWNQRVAGRPYRSWAMRGRSSV